MKKIYLSSSKNCKNNGKYCAIVDDEDYDYLSQWLWQVSCGRKINYARSTIQSKQILMHRLIMGATEGQIIDHIDGDGLNNQRSNLRFCTHSQNSSNWRPSDKSKYMGITKVGTRWVARICHNGNKYILGSFFTEQEAAMEYDRMTIILNKEFASTNFEYD